MLFFYVFKRPQTALMCERSISFDMSGRDAQHFIWACGARKKKEDAWIRTHDFLRIGRALYQLRQSSIFLAFVFVVYKLCSSYYMLLFRSKTIYLHEFWPTLLFHLKDNHFGCPAKVLHYRIQNFFVGNLSLTFSRFKIF